jgi:hypothetical protein
MVRGLATGRVRVPGAIGPRRGRALLAAAAALAVVALVAAGLLALGSRGTDRGRPDRSAAPPKSSPTTIRRAGLRIQVPAGWAATAHAPRLPGIAFAQPLSLAEPGGDIQVVAGELAATSTTLLPARFLAGLDRALPPPRRVRLAGEVNAYHYAGLSHRQLNSFLDVYVVPTTAGVATVACLADNVGLLLDACWRVVSKLSLASAQPVPLGPAAGFRVALISQVHQLDAADARAKQDIARASTPAEQATAFSRLQPVYRQAAATLAPLAPRSVEQPRQIVDSIDDLAHRYGAAERALSRVDRQAFAAAKAGTRKRRAHLERLLAAVLPPSS